MEGQGGRKKRNRKERKKRGPGWETERGAAEKENGKETERDGQTQGKGMGARWRAGFLPMSLLSFAMDVTRRAPIASKKGPKRHNGRHATAWLATAGQSARGRAAGARQRSAGRGDVVCTSEGRPGYIYKIIRA